LLGFCQSPDFFEIPANTQRSNNIPLPDSRDVSIYAFQLFRILHRQSFRSYRSTYLQIETNLLRCANASPDTRTHTTYFSGREKAKPSELNCGRRHFYFKRLATGGASNWKKECFAVVERDLHMAQDGVPVYRTIRRYPRRG